MSTAKNCTLTIARRAIASAWRANDSALTVKHIADGHQDLDSIMRYSTELTIRLETALTDAKRLEEIARRDVEQRNQAAAQHAALMLEVS